MSDLIIIGVIWFLSYNIRFYSDIIPVYKGIPPFKIYLYLIIPISLIWPIVFKSFGLYKPKRVSSYLKEVFDIVKACTFSVLLLISLTFFFRQYEYSRLVFFGFWIMAIIALSMERVIFRELLRYLRRKGYNLRYVLVVGTGDLARDVHKRLEFHPELGMKVVGFVSHTQLGRRGALEGIPVIGDYRDVKRIIERERIDQVIIALPIGSHSVAVEVLKEICNEMVDIKVVPDLCEFMTLRGGVDELDGIPIISLQDTPLYGWNIIIKRVTDIIVSIVALIITTPLMVMIAILVKITSPGPVFYQQERMGIGGDTFQMLKFRTMSVGAERDTGAVWTSKDDPRRTKFGSFLRRTSLDELPQFFNVIKGDMSIVGPRPERPVFIQEFRGVIPMYMLRHKMKAGITGWAQVNGWRGNTDISKRIEYDLYYIENWSIWLDLKIMYLTLWEGFIHKNAY